MADEEHDRPARRTAMCRTLVATGATVDRVMTDRFHMNPDLAMVLAIYLAEAEHRDVYLWQVAHMATASNSTAHRKLCEMADLGLLTRSRTTVDRRRICLQLAPATRAQIDRLLDKLADPRQRS